MKKHCEKMLADKDKITEQQRIIIESTLGELEASKGNAQELQNKVDKLTEKLKVAGARPAPSTSASLDEEPTINTLVIKNVPTDGRLRFGLNSWQQSVQVLKFDQEEGKNVKNLRITGCQNLIQVDLSHLVNLEKISLRNSKWDNIKGAKNIIPITTWSSLKIAKMLVWLEWKELM